MHASVDRMFTSAEHSGEAWLMRLSCIKRNAFHQRIDSTFPPKFRVINDCARPALPIREKEIRKG